MPVVKELQPVERKGGSEIRVEKVFKMFRNRTLREGDDKGVSWFHWMYTFLPEDERKAMSNRIKNSNEMKMDGVPTGKIEKKKEDLLKSLETFSNGRDKDFSEIFSKKTPFERDKRLIEDQASLMVVEKAFKRWGERENEFKGASPEDWLKMWFEEMDPTEISKWKKKISRLAEIVGLERIKPLGEALVKREENMNGIYKEWEKEDLGKREATREEEREGLPVVFLGDIGVSVNRQLEKWFIAGLNKEGIEEEVALVKADTEYTERIIRRISCKAIDGIV